MNRHETYMQVFRRLQSLKGHAKESGDGVQADKLRKIYLDVSRLVKSDDTDMSKECD